MKLKTREALRSVKTLDRGAEGFANKTRDGVSSVNRSAEQTQNVGYETENEYATHEVETREEAMIKGTISGAERFGRWGVRNTWRNIQKWRNRPRKENVDINPKQLNPPKRPMLTEGTKKGAKTATGKDCRFKDFRFTLDFTQVPYRVEGPVTLNERGVFFKNLPIYDMFSGKGVVNGALTYNYFSDVAVDAKVDFTNM